MSDLSKYKGIFPALYGCYDENMDISVERTQAYTKYLIDKGINGLYVGGSSGECIYQTIEERKLVLESVMQVAKNRIPIIVHVGAVGTRDAIKLAEHAEKTGADALSSVPPIYFSMSEIAIEKYWVDIYSSTKLPFIIYNIPSTTPYSITVDMIKKMASKDQVIGIKNSSMPVLDIMKERMYANKPFVVFNGPDEQYVAGRLMGADGGIGGTYGAMVEMFLKAEQLIASGNISKAQEIQIDINNLIFSFFSLKANMYAVIKESLKQRGMNIGGARLPLYPVNVDEIDKVKEITKNLEKAIVKWS